MRGNDQAPLEQVLHLIEVATQMAGELSARTEAREELIGALTIAAIAGMRLAAEETSARRTGRKR